MLKLLGALIILVVSVLYGRQLSWKLKQHLTQLLEVQELFRMLAGEIQYHRTPLAEAFAEIGKRGKEPYGSILCSIAEEMGQCNGCLSEVWKRNWSGREDLFFQKEELDLLLEAGSQIGYLDAGTLLQQLDYYQKQLEHRIVQAREELAVKQKLYQYLSVMSGMFLILILI